MPRKTRFIIGTSGWNYDSWQGPFYPKDLPKKQWFAYYKQFFDVVEANATFYRLFPRSVFKKWHDCATSNFKYIVKVNRYITHIKRLKNCRAAIQKFNNRVKYLENRLALLLLQLPPRMPYDLKRLEKAISYFPDPKKIVVEFRDKRWFTKETFALLKKKGCILCLADSPDIKLEARLTSNIVYIRMHGRKRWFNYKYTRTELREVANCAKKLAAIGAKKVYILFNNDYFSYAIQNAMEIDLMLNDA